MCEQGECKPLQSEGGMSYYIGFRHGWLRIGRRLIAWQDSALYPYLPGRTVVAPWKVWFK